MAFIPVDGVIQLTTTYADQDGIPAVNRFWCKPAFPPTLELLTLACTTFSDFFGEVLNANTASNWSLVGLKARDYTTEFGLEFVQSADLPQPGTHSGTLNPNNVSGTVTWLTGFVGRSFRGRTFLVGLPYSDVVANGKQLSDAAVSFHQGAWDAFKAAYDSANLPLQVVSFFNAGVARVSGLATPVTAPRVNHPIATQRRRLK